MRDNGRKKENERGSESKRSTALIGWAAAAAASSLVTCLMACSLPGSVGLDPAAAEGGAVSDLFPSLLGRGGTDPIWPVTGRVHPSGRGRRWDHGTRNRERLNLLEFLILGLT